MTSSRLCGDEPRPLGGRVRDDAPSRRRRASRSRGACDRTSVRHSEPRTNVQRRDDVAVAARRGLPHQHPVARVARALEPGSRGAEQLPVQARRVRRARATYCGRQEAGDGWARSRPTSSRPGRRSGGPTAVTKRRKRVGLGRVTRSSRERVAQRGPGPLTVTSTRSPRARASASSGRRSPSCRRIGGRVGLVEGRHRPRVGVRRDVLPVQHDAQPVHAERLDSSSACARTAGSALRTSRVAWKIVNWDRFADAADGTASAASATATRAQSRQRKLVPFLVGPEPARRTVHRRRERSCGKNPSSPDRSRGRFAGEPASRIRSGEQRSGRCSRPIVPDVQMQRRTTAYATPCSHRPRPRLLAAPAASAAPIDGGERNPSNNASSGYSARDPDHRRDRPERRRPRRRHRRLRHPPVQQVRHRRRRDLRLPRPAGTESCVAANNLANGDAFRFQVHRGRGDDRPVALRPGHQQGHRQAAVRDQRHRAGEEPQRRPRRRQVRRGLRSRRAACCSPPSPPTARSRANRGVPANTSATIAADGGEPGVHRPVLGRPQQVRGHRQPDRRAPRETDTPLIVGHRHGNRHASSSPSRTPAQPVRLRAAGHLLSSPFVPDRRGPSGPAVGRTLEHRAHVDTSRARAAARAARAAVRAGDGGAWLLLFAAGRLAATADRGGARRRGPGCPGSTRCCCSTGRSARSCSWRCRRCAAARAWAADFVADARLRARSRATGAARSTCSGSPASRCPRRRCRCAAPSGSARGAALAYLARRDPRRPRAGPAAARLDRDARDPRVAAVHARRRAGLRRRGAAAAVGASAPRASGWRSRPSASASPGSCTTPPSSACTPRTCS